MQNLNPLEFHYGTNREGQSRGWPPLKATLVFSPGWVYSLRNSGVLQPPAGPMGKPSQANPQESLHVPYARYETYSLQMAEGQSKACLCSVSLGRLALLVRHCIFTDVLTLGDKGEHVHRG